MNSNTRNAVDFAFDGNIMDMQNEIQSALLQKVADIIDGKRQEVAANIFNTNENQQEPEDNVEEEVDESVEQIDEISRKLATNYMMKVADRTQSGQETAKQREGGFKTAFRKVMGGPVNVKATSDLGRLPDLKSAATKLKAKIAKEELEETLSVSDGVDAWIHDFVHSDDPKFSGKSKKERIQMALGAFYSAKKGKTRNEEVEQIDELSRKTLGSYIKKAAFDAGESGYTAGESPFPSKGSKFPSKKDRMLKRAEKRLKGIQTAADKLSQN